MPFKNTVFFLELMYFNLLKYMVQSEFVDQTYFQSYNDLKFASL